MNCKLAITIGFASLCFSLAYGKNALAHFPWLATDSDGKALYFFGETVAERSYKLPEKIATAEVAMIEKSGVLKSLEMIVVESDAFTGKQSRDSFSTPISMQSKVTFGIHGGTMLDYYTQYTGGPLSKSFDDQLLQSNNLSMHAEAIDTDTGVLIRIVWNGKPLAGVDVRLFCSEGHEEAIEKTNGNGEVHFSDKQVENGLNGIVVGHRIDESGTFEGHKYKSASHYLTMTFFDPQDFGTSQDRETGASVQPKPYGNMPLALTSFGAVRHKNMIYAFGGHTGEAHHYSIQEQSNALITLDLSKPGSEWKELSKNRRLQGLGLVSHGQRLIRVGGFEAVNGIDEQHDLRSTDEVAAFDLESQSWSALPSLPEPRSSHDAIVLGDQLYVIGGWTLMGEETTWLTTAWTLDLSRNDAKWEALPQPTFTRRAVALATLDSRIYVIGGMNEKGGPTSDVNYFDSIERTWHSAPPLQGRPMNGFGASAWQVAKAVVATTIDGDIQRLSLGSSAWENIGKTRDARFFHRLLPFDDGHLIAIGGANMAKGKFPNVEIISTP